MVKVFKPTWLDWLDTGTKLFFKVKAKQYTSEIPPIHILYYDSQKIYSY